MTPQEKAVDFINRFGARSYTEGSEESFNAESLPLASSIYPPFKQLSAYPEKEPTVATDNTKTLTTCNGRIIHGICDRCYNNAQTSSAYCTRLVECPPQEPTRRKLVTDELIEWTEKEIARINKMILRDRDSAKLRSNIHLLEQSLQLSQSLRAREEENIINTSFEFYYDMSQKMKVDFNKISENRDNAKEFFTKTYKP